MNRALHMYSLFLLALACVAMSVAVVKSSSDAILAIVAGAAAILLTFCAHRINKRARACSTPPVVLPDDFHVPFVVNHTKGLSITLVVALLVSTGGTYVFSPSEPLTAVLFAAVAVSCAHAVVSALRERGMPALIVDDRGITSRNFGLVPWEEIDRVHLIEVRSFRVAVVLNVYDPEKYLRRLNPLRRWLKSLNLRSRDLIEIELYYVDRTPAYISAAVNKLRAKYAAGVGVVLKTGDLSIDILLTEINKLVDSLGREDDHTKQRMVRRRIDELNGDLLAEIGENTRNARKDVITTAAILAAFVVFYLWFLLFAR